LQRSDFPFHSLPFLPQSDVLIVLVWFKNHVFLSKALFLRCAFFLFQHDVDSFCLPRSVDAFFAGSSHFPFNVLVPIFIARNFLAAVQSCVENAFLFCPHTSFSGPVFDKKPSRHSTPGSFEDIGFGSGLPPCYPFYPLSFSALFSTSARERALPCQSRAFPSPCKRRPPPPRPPARLLPFYAVRATSVFFFPLLSPAWQPSLSAPTGLRPEAFFFR